jgi:hypothetical protein
MSLDRVPTQMLAQDNVFLSKAAAQAANLGRLGAKTLYVVEDGEVVIYHPVAGAVDLVGADGSRWKWGSVGTPDLIALAGDLSAQTTSITQDEGAITPVLSWSGGGGTFAYTLQTGRWNQLGVHTHIDISVSATLTTLGTGNLRVGGLAAGQRPVTGLFPGYLDIKAKNDGFLFPKEAGNFHISWTGGAEHGVFSYFSASGFSSAYVTGLTGGTPSGNNEVVTWTGGSGKALDWQPLAGDPTQGRLVLHNITGDDPTGAITNGTWSATVTGQWSGARSGERFMNADNFSAGQIISFTAHGRWLVG